MKIFSYCIKSLSIIIIAVTQILVFCSCASQEWITAQKEKIFDQHVNNMRKEFDKKNATANVNMDKLMDSAKLQLADVNSSTGKFKNLNAEALELIKRVVPLQQSFVKKMETIDKDLRQHSKNCDKILFKKIFDHVKNDTSVQIREWKTYSMKTSHDSAKEYEGFLKSNSLYKIAELPVSRKMRNPLNTKIMQLLDIHPKIIGQRENDLLAAKNNLKSNMKLQELLYIYNSLLNCRTAGNKISGTEIGMSSWQFEESLLANHADRKQDKEVLQVLAYNRMMICDFMIRRLNLTEEYPVELAYFIYQLKFSANYIDDPVWKKLVSNIISKYICAYDKIGVMSHMNNI